MAIRRVSGEEFVDQARSEDPARAGIAENVSSSEEISHSQLQKRVELADPDLALEVARGVSRRWPNTIAALGD